MFLLCPPWLPTEAIFNLDILFGLPTAFYSLSLLGLAAKSRAAIYDIEDLSEQRSKLANVLVDEDDLLVHPWASWFRSSFVFSACEARVALIRLDLVPRKRIREKKMENRKQSYHFQFA